jgi:prepilin-type N-terminal cleavage/methylation domain-containing protein
LQSRFSGSSNGMRAFALAIRNPQSAIRNRSGFTLLELLLASGIALLLMAGLYVAMDVNLNYAAAGREVVDQSQLARTLLNRIATDVAGALSPITATKSVSSTSATVVAEEGAVSFTAVTPLNMGVVGDSTLLTLYVSRVPKWGPGIEHAVATEQQPFGISDLRRITYWLSAVGDGGLARQDIDRVTADSGEDTQLPPGLPNEERLIIAPEVVGIAFRYFDGSTWLESWDGSMIGADLATPIGPPRAIEIRLDIRDPSAPREAENAVRSYRHVVAIGAANAQPATSAETEPTTGTTTTGGGP